jgi:ELWxxDGT repeat protein
MAGNTLNNATRIRVRANTPNIDGRVSGSDPNDFYRFRIGQPATFSAVLRNVSDDVSLSLLDNRGRVVLFSDSPNDGSEVISSLGVGTRFTQDPFIGASALRTGVYYLLVQRKSGRTDYDLKIAAAPDPRFPPPVTTEIIDRERLGRARELRVNDRTRSYRGELERGDREDLFFFRTSEVRQLSVTMRNLDADAALAIVGSDGREITRSDRSEKQAEVAVARVNLPPRPNERVYIRVIGKGRRTDYKLTFTATPISTSAEAPPIGNARVVQDINPGGANSNPTELATLGEFVYFAAEDDTNGRELWRTNGTTTELVRDINSGTSGSDPTELVVVGNVLYFAANDGTTGKELWRSDGTEEGTVLVSDINEGNASSNPTDLAAVGDVLYFAADGGTDGRELWRSDGTSAGTDQVRDINHGNEGSNPRDLVNLNGVLYFAADGGTDGRELWRSNGTSAGTDQVRDISSGNGSSNPTDLVSFNDRIYFAATTESDGTELWSSDGTSSGTFQVANINSGAGSSSPTDLTVFGNAIYFAANDGDDGTELWRSDGTRGNAEQVEDIENSGSSSPRDLYVATGFGASNSGTALFFTAETNEDDRQIWRFNGTQVVQESDAVLNTFAPADLASLGNVLFFAGGTPSEGRELLALNID